MTTTYIQLTPEQVSEMIDSAVSKAIAALKITKPAEMITRKELCKRLSISEPTAIFWGKKGKLIETRIGSSVRYDWSLAQNGTANK